MLGAPVRPARAADDEHGAGAELGGVRARGAGSPRPRPGRSARRPPAQPAARRGDPDRRSRAPRPRAPCPGTIHRPGLAAWKVAVAAARTAAPATAPRRRVDAARDVGRDDRCAGGVHRLDRARDRLARRAREAGAEHRVDDHRRAARAPPARRRPGRAPGRRSRLAAASPRSSAGIAEQQHRDLAALLAQQPRRDQPVAAVVALAAHDRDRTVGRHARRRRRASPSPARSMRSSEGTPRSSIAHASVARMRCGVGKRLEPGGKGHGPMLARAVARYSTVTVFARLRGWSTFRPRWRAMR